MKKLHVDLLWKDSIYAQDFHLKSGIGHTYTYQLRGYREV